MNLRKASPFTLLTLSIVFFFTPFVYGQATPSGEEISTCKEVQVHVRTIEGIVSADASHDKLALTLDPRIQDLQAQLEKFHYQHYRLLADTSATVPIAKRRVVKLSNGNKLTIRPIYANDKRVGVWLHWKDAQGMEVLNSRLHFDSQKDVLTGLETSDSRGLFLAVHVSPLPIK